MKAGTEIRHPATKLLLPAIGLVLALVAKGSVAATDGIELTQYNFGLSAYVFGHTSGAPFHLPEQLVTKSGFSALNLNGQPSIPIVGIRGVFDVSDLVLINGVSGKKEIRGNLAVGYEVGSFGELEVFSDTSLGALAEYGRDPVGGVHQSPAQASADWLQSLRDVTSPGRDLPGFSALFFKKNVTAAGCLDLGRRG